MDLSQPISWLLEREGWFESLVGGGWGHRRLNLLTFREFKPVERARINAHLGAFERALAGGDAVMVAPEGANSPDGHFQRPRAGPWRLAGGAPAELPVLPVGLAYDPSVSGRRMRVFVHAGAPLRAGDFVDRRSFDDAVSSGILGATALTGSHLAAHWVLRAGPGEKLSPEAFERFAAEFGSALSGSGLRVAPDAGAQALRRLRWFGRAGLVNRTSRGAERSAMQEPAPGWESRAALAAFLRNELASAAALAPAVAARFGLRPPSYVPSRHRRTCA